MREIIKSLIRDSINTKERVIASELGNIEKAAQAIISCLRSGNKVIVFGNGGSAADSQHIAAELIGRFKLERKALAAIALTTDTSIITALGNDYGFDSIFARQIEGLGKSGDVALGISTSGNSNNVRLAVEKAKSMGIYTIGLLGGSGGTLKSECDLAIVVDSKDTARVQESHITIAHILCGLVEEEICQTRS
jgi:D-sedoheptulose 7-phosphate isomerase